MPEPDSSDWQRGGMAYAGVLKTPALTGLWVRVPPLLPKQVDMKTPKKNRNAYAVPAKARKAGEMRPKKDKRKNGKNKQVQYLEDTYT